MAVEGKRLLENVGPLVRVGPVLRGFLGLFVRAYGLLGRCTTCFVGFAASFGADAGCFGGKSFDGFLSLLASGLLFPPEVL